jgi:hypothetical protein
MVVHAETFDSLTAGQRITDLGNWSELSSGVEGDGTGEVRPLGTSAANARCEVDTGSADMYARLRSRLVGSDAAGNGQVGIMVRVPSAANTGTGYMLMAEHRNNGTVDTRLRLSQDNSRSDLTANVSQALTAGAFVQLEIQVEGTEIRGYVDGVLRHTVTDATLTGGTLGGMYLFNNGGWAVAADDFEQGALSDLGGGDTALAPANTSHGHTASVATITQVHVLEPADSMHAQSAGTATLTADVALEPDDATHTHTATSPTLSQDYTLTAADATHGHTATSPTLSTNGPALDPVGFIVGEVVGPLTITAPTPTGAALARVVTGSALRRKVTGPAMRVEDITGPERVEEPTPDGPTLRREVDGPELARTLTGPEV